MRRFLLCLAHVFTSPFLLLSDKIRDFPSGYPELEWVHVDDNHFWIYGAFWDNRNRDLPGVILDTQYVRLYVTGPYRYQKFIGELKQSFCEYTYFNSSARKVPVVAVQPPNFDWNNPRSSSIHFYAYCNIPDKSSSPQLPVSVSLVTTDGYSKAWRADLEGRRRKFLLPIRKPDLANAADNYPKQLKKLAFCVKPFYGNWASFKGTSGFFDPVELIVNFFAYYTAVGVEHFTLYDQGTTSAQVYRLLNLVRSIGVSVEILPWNFRERYGYGMFQTLSIETCIHRNYGVYENVIVVRRNPNIISYSLMTLFLCLMVIYCCRGISTSLLFLKIMRICMT